MIQNYVKNVSKYIKEHEKYELLNFENNFLIIIKTKAFSLN